ncbi:MAG: lytic transglycosylase domain-containing protein [Thermoleophilaceae bacterium]
MSVEAVQSRMSEIQSMIAACSGQTPASTGATPGTSFDQQLQSATGQLGVAASPAGAQGSGANTPFAAQIDSAAQKYGVDPALLRGLIKQESGFNPNAGSSAGAQGLTQLMPATARSLGCTNPLDPAQSIDAGAKYLRQQLDTFGGDVRKALAAYNAGPGAVQRYGGVPPYGETQNYVQKVMAYADEYRRGGSSATAMQAAAQSNPLSYSTT